MNCVNHPETAATAFCRSCGRALCPVCQVHSMGTVYCSEHAPAPQPAAAPPSGWVPPPPSATSGVSPGLAFFLGLIPGVGAIYNGQYAKGLIHVVIFGLLISIISSGAAGGFEPMFGVLIPAWIFYMAFEAYHTAKKREAGIPVDEFSSIVPLRANTGFPVAPILLIAAGVLFLLINLDVLRFQQIIRYWPVALIALGAYMLYCRITQDNSAPTRVDQEVGNEH